LLKVNQIHNSLSERYLYYYIGKPCTCGFTTSEPLQEFHLEPLLPEIIPGPPTIVPPEPRESIPLDPPTVDPSVSRPLQTYHRRQPASIVPVPRPGNISEAIADSPPTPSPSPDSVLSPESESDLPIFVRIGIRPTRN